MHIPGGKILNAYPYQGEEQAQKELFLRLKKKYGFEEDDDQLIINISNHVLSTDLIKNHAAGCYYGDLHSNQMRFFKIVKLTKHCPSAVIAGGNALRVLLETDFSFQSTKTQKLSRIHATGVLFKNKVLDGVNLKGATLTNCHFIRTSMNGVILDNADLPGVTFGQLPYLVHNKAVLAMALSKDGSLLVSHSEEAIYLWNAKDGSFVEKKSIGKYKYLTSSLSNYSPNIILKFLPNCNSFLRASGKGELEVWGINPLKPICHVAISQAYSFTFFDLSKDGKYCLSIARLPQKKESILGVGQDRLDVWGIEEEKEKSYHFTNLFSLIIEGTIRQVAFSDAKQILGVIIYNSSSIEFYDLAKKVKKEEWTFSLGKDMLSVSSLCFTQDGSKVLFGIGKSLFVLDYEKKQHSCLISSENTDKESPQSNVVFDNCQFLPNSSLLMYYSWRTLCIRDMSKNCLVKMQREFEVSAHSPLGIFFTCDGKQLIQAQNNLITITPLSETPIEKSLPFGISFVDILFLNQRLHLVNTHGDLFQYRLQSCSQAFVRPLQEHTFGKHLYMVDSWLPYRPDNSFATTLAQLSSDGEWVISGSKLSDQHQILISSVSDGTEIFRYQSFFSAFAVSQDNSHLIITYQNELQLWDLKSKVCIKKCQIEKVPDYEVDLIISDNIFPICIAVLTHRENFTSVIWKINWNALDLKGQKIATLPHATKPVFINSQDILFHGGEKGLILWNGLKGKSKTIKPCKYYIDDCDASKNGTIVFSYETREENHSVIALYGIKKKKILDKIHLVGVHSPKVYIAADGSHLLVTAQHGNIIDYLSLWEIVQGHFQIKWKLPQELEARGMSVKNVKNLSEPVRRLLTQIGAIDKKQ